MSAKKKTVFGIILLTFTLIIGYIFYGLNIMADEDKYGDLVYIGEKVENGDIILKCSAEYSNNDKSEFDKIGLIEKSFGKVYVWDYNNTVKKTLFNWAERQNAQKIIVLRAKSQNIKKVIPKVEGKYNYLLYFDDYEIITKTL
jgi:hypothetical protein